MASHGIPDPAGLPSHRRVDAILLDVHEICRHAAVLALRAGEEYRGTRLQQALVSRNRRQDRHVRADAVFRLAILEFDMHDLALRGFGHGTDRGVGHHAVRAEIPRELPAAIWLSLRENPDLYRMQLAVRALHAGGGEEVAGLDVGQGFLDETLDPGRVRHRDLHVHSVPRLYCEIGAIDLLDRAPNPHRRRSRRVLSERGQRKKQGKRRGHSRFSKHPTLPIPWYAERCGRGWDLSSTAACAAQGRA